MKRRQETYFEWNFSEFEKYHLESVNLPMGEEDLFIQGIGFATFYHNQRRQLVMTLDIGWNNQQLVDTDVVKTIDQLLSQVPSKPWITGVGRACNSAKRYTLAEYQMRLPQNRPLHEIVLRTFDEVAVLLGRPELFNESSLWFDVVQRTFVYQEGWTLYSSYLCSKHGEQRSDDETES